VIAEQREHAVEPVDALLAEGAPCSTNAARRRTSTWRMRAIVVPPSAEKATVFTSLSATSVSEEVGS
jgi:hypothetical protein